MKYTFIPRTNLRVSKICLGTMTWGRQNTQDEAFEQMNYALDQGVNFFDTAELYPIPPKKELYALTEEYIGNWFAQTGNRSKVVLASKIAGPAPFSKYIRETGFAKQALIEALDGSLKRLQTDYLDLYQLHWPERATNFFGQRGYPDDQEDFWEDNIHQVLETLGNFVKQGKVRHVGLSNETPWGTMRYLEESKVHEHLPRMVTVQNPYSLLNRTYEVGMAEVGIREKIGLLAYSPLGFGVLSGKYLDGIKPRKSRLALFPHYGRYSTENATKATKAYFDLAQKHDLSLTQMALAFVHTRPFLTSTIIGATSMTQLQENINSIEVTLSKEVIEAINQIHESIPNPAP